MFKKFSPKEDIASSTALKSSIQRQHRTKLLAQIPFLSLPAAPLERDDAGASSDEDSDDAGTGGGGTRKKMGAGKEKRSAKAEKEKSGKGGKKGRGGAAAAAAAAAEEKKPEDEAGADGAAGGGEDVLTVLDTIWPKKEGLTLVKCRDHVTVLALHGEPLFFQHFEGPYFPTLKLLHRYPQMLPKVGVDRGAIKFVLSGANIMCPGLTSPTAYLPPSTANIPVDRAVAVFAYGKEEPLAVGLTKMSSDDIRAINKNIGVDNVHYLGDDLWRLDKI